MITPGALNELEKLDILLSKLDAVRYALPEVLDFFTAATSESSSYSSPQDRVQDYHDRVRKVERSLQDLHTGSSSLADTLSRLTGQADSLKLDRTKVSRVRKNPYSGRIHDAHPKNDKDVHKLPYLSPNAASLDSVELLNSELQRLAEEHPNISIRQPCEKWNKRMIVLELKGLALFHVALSWPKRSELASFQRVNVIGVNEEKQTFQESAFFLWKSVSIQASQGMLRHGRKDFLDLSCLLSLVESYASIQSQPCFACLRLAHEKSLHLPTARVYQSMTSQSTEGKWFAYHEECYVTSAR